MTVTPTEHRMTSDVTPHTATRITPSLWVLSFLPGRKFLRNDATMGMQAAEEIVTGQGPMVVRTFAVRHLLRVHDLVYRVMAPVIHDTHADLDAGFAASDQADADERSRAQEAGADQTAQAEADAHDEADRDLCAVEICDACAIPTADKPDHLSAFLDQNPEIGEVFADRDDRPWFVVFRWSEVLLVSSGGSQQSPATVCDRYGPLTRARIVPADAIVLERPSLADTIDLSAAVGGGEGINTPPVAVFIEGSARRVLLLTGCQSCSNPTLTCPQARTMAAHTALAAVEAGTL